MSGKEVRGLISDQVRASEDFRAGVIYAAHNKHSSTYPTVDIAIVNEKNQLLLGRKSDDLANKWRFLGGFVDPTKDRCLEDAARREANEETSHSLEFDSEFKYLGSTYIDDWRYRKELDKIMTSVFKVKALWGSISSGDDICEVQWKELDSKLESIVAEQHLPILEMLRKDLN
jgi:bifunctional NMN adenylyltransferase/nudix hydrolase